MGLFEHGLNPKILQQSNAIWNELQLNARWSVGMVTALIQQEVFNSKEEWEAFYYESGRRRNELVQSLPPQTQVLLNEPREIRRMEKSLKDLNYLYGRTPEQLKEKAKLFYEVLVLKDATLTLEICERLVWFRVIGETWNGVVGRERGVVQNLTQWINYYPNLSYEFRKTTGVFDYEYEVDYELYLNQCRRLGIQIKPDSYRFATPYLLEAHRINQLKNERYCQTFQVPIIYVYANTRGTISNPEEVYGLLQQLIPTKRRG